MADAVKEWPIMFSGPMVRALLARTKTQTRRLAASPLRKCQPGDRLWVRETFTQTQYGKAVYRADACDQGGARWSSIAPGDPDGEVKWKPAIHMPRTACRLTLRVTEIRFQRLHDITEADARAEGVVWSERWQSFVVPGIEHQNKDFPVLSRATAREMYAALWDALHGSGYWAANPSVVALTFDIENRDG